MITLALKNSKCSYTAILLSFSILIIPVITLKANVNVKEEGDKLIINNNIMSFVINLRTGEYSGQSSDGNVVLFNKAAFTVGYNRWKEPEAEYSWEESSVDDELGKGICVTIYKKPAEGYKPVQILLIRLYDNQSYAVLGWGVQNNFDYPLRIKHADLLLEGELYVGQQMNSPQVLRGGAGSESNYVEDTDKIEALNSVLLTYKDGNQRRSIVAGGLKYKEFIRTIEIAEKKGRGSNNPEYHGKAYLTLALDDPYGKLVNSGEKYISEDTYFIDFTTSDPFESLERLGNVMAMVNNAKPNFYDFPTLCGWAISTHAYGEGRDLNHSAGMIEQVDIASEKGFLKYSPIAVRVEPDYYCYNNYGNTEQGWWDDEHFARFGHLRSPYETFKKFCKGVIEKGGIPFTYFQVSLPSNDFAIAHPEWMLNNDISGIHITHAHHHPIIRYDYTDPDFQEYMRTVWRRMKDDGLKGVKFDYPETAWNINGGFEDSSYTTTSAYRKVFELCREGLGEEAFIHERNLGESDAPRTDATVGIIDLQRVTGDGSHFTTEMITRIGLRWFKNRNCFLYYPDSKTMLEIQTKEPISTKLRRAILSGHSLIAGRLELATSFSSMNEEIIHDISRIYPAVKSRKAPRPVDMFTRKKHPEVYLYKVTPTWLNALFFNTDTVKSEVSAPLSGNMVVTGSLGLDPENEYHIFEFWNQEYYGKVTGNDIISAHLDPCEVCVYSIRQKAEHPQIISTNRHIMQGLVELENVNWEPVSGILGGTAILTGGDEMRITIAANGYVPGKIKVNGFKYGLSKHPLHNDLYELNLLSNNDRKVEFELRFMKIK